VLQSVTFDVFIDAEEDSECYIISGPAFAHVADNNTDIKIFSLETAVSRFSDVMWVMQQILFMSLDRRLAIFLIDESTRTGSDVIELTHEQIAKYMGSAREVVSRMLKYFANEKIVEVSRKGVKILDKRRLRDLTLYHCKYLTLGAGARSLIYNLAVFDNNERRYTHNTELLCKLRLIVNVYLSDNVCRVFFCDLVNDGGHHTAGSAPVGIEV